MKKSLILIISLFCLSLLLVVPATDSATRKQARKEYKEKRKKVAWEPDQKKFFISGKITGGILTGEVADYFEDTSDKLVYGFGGCLEYLIRPRIVLGVNFEMSWKAVPEYSEKDLKGTSFSASGMYLFCKNTRSSPYARLEFGWINPKWNDNDLGTHSLLRIGLGFNNHFTKHTLGRFEAFYRIILCDGSDLGDYSGEADFNVTYFGLEFTFGLKL